MLERDCGSLLSMASARPACEGAGVVDDYTVAGIAQVSFIASVPCYAILQVRVGFCNTLLEHK